MKAHKISRKRSRYANYFSFFINMPDASPRYSE